MARKEGDQNNIFVVTSFLNSLIKPANNVENNAVVYLTMFIKKCIYSEYFPDTYYIFKS